MDEYIVSARKYRPATFDAVVGQTALTTTLKNAVKSGKLAHAYLFCGPRGVGKTTCARIFAKAINCQHPTPDGEACNECESCKAFNEQRSYNIFELDAASNNSVEHIKTLMEQTRIPPQVGRYKVFIIDEVHMLSTAAFNAFLKTLEEPPAHVIFILATTEKHKILPTILSRCQIYDFERMTVSDTIAHLKKVAAKEGITCEDEALHVIAEKADGGMRDALSIFDQAASFCQGNITYRKVIEDLNVLDSDNYFRIVDLSLQNKVPDIMLLLNKIINKGFDGGQLVGGLARHLRSVLMAKDESTLPLLDVSEQQRTRFREQATRCSATFIYKALKITNSCDMQYRQSSNKQLLVELTLIEIAQITQPDDDSADGAGRKPRRLKSLFQNFVRQNRHHKETDKQVVSAGAGQPAAADTQTTAQTAGKTMPAAGARASMAAKETPSESTESKAPTEGYNKLKRPRLKTANGTVGYSWNNLRQTARPRKMQVIPGTLGPNDPNENRGDEHEAFTQDDLEFQWMSMCNRMPQKFSGIASRMKNMSPKINGFPAIELTVDNKIIMEEMENIRKSILKTLKIYLHNADITFELKVNEAQGSVKVLTRREQYEELSRKNPAIEKLRELLGLELA